MIPLNAKAKCVLSSSLTDGGNISLVLEALNPGDHQECKDALLAIIDSIDRNKSVRNSQPRFKMAAFIDLESWARNQLLDVQDQLLNAAEDAKDKANMKVVEKVQEVDRKIPVNGISTLPAQVYTYVSLLSLNILLK